MQNVYLIRTAAVVSIGATMLGLSWLRTPADEMRIAPEMVAVSSTPAEPAVYFPAGFELQANVDEPEVYEYY
jgi:hypothetical protein